MILKGKIAEPIRIHGKIGKALPTFTVTFKDGNNTLQQVQVKQGRTATYNGTVPAKDGNAFLGWVLTESSNPIVDSDDVTAYQQIPNVQADITCWAVYSDKRIIHDSWADISQYSQAGTAQNHYSVGDMKRIHIEGTVGTLAVNQDVYVYILGFDHNSTLEGNGITFGCFKKQTTYKDICLVDSTYYSYSTDGTKAFNISHWGNNNYGGWAGSDLRYDILGSTDVAPSNYGTTPDSSRIGYDATSTCATNPVANTLMSCLPSDLRAVMKPLIKYTDNIGNRAGRTPVTDTTDYLPLLSEFEVFGTASYSNSDKQEQYAYFADTSKNKAKNSQDIGDSYNIRDLANWWLRSPGWHSDSDFCYVSSNGSPMSTYTYGSISEYGSRYSYGISPIFLV